VKYVLKMYLKTLSRDFFCMYRCTFHCETSIYFKYSVYFLQADPYSKWAILNVKNEDLPVSEVFPHFLADSHHQVSILAAKSITR